MKRVVVLLAILAMAGITNANLLTNGNFEDSANGWEVWCWGDGWANIEQADWGNGTSHVSVGAQGNGGGGYYQVVSATAGVEYTLTVSSGADDWWLPTGYMTIFFLDATGNELSQVSRNTVDPAAYGENYDIEHPWESYSLSALAPDDTAQIKVEFAANWATGSVGFDNAVLVPEPATIALLGLAGLMLRNKK